jgi:hypothetical protein
MKPDGDGTVRVGYAVHYDMDIIRQQCAAIDRAEGTLTCATCILLSGKDNYSYCTLTGQTRRGGDVACAQHSDGRVEDKPKRRCQNCGHAIIVRRAKGMPTITCDDGTREGWDRSREWGQTCDGWIKKQAN